MFESAELGHKIDKATYDAQIPELREDLPNAQFDLALKARFPVIILVGGVDGAGKILPEALRRRLKHTAQAAQANVPPCKRRSTA